MRRPAPPPPASATPNREPRLAPDGVSEAIALAGAGRTPRMLLLDAPSDDTGMLLLLGFLLGIAYATGLRCLFRRESFSRRRSGAGALVSRRRVARRTRR